MDLTPNGFYWLRGNGVARFDRALGSSKESTVVFATYDRKTDTFWGEGYVGRDDVLREASPEDVAMFKEAVQRAFAPRVPTQRWCPRCRWSGQTTQLHCIKCGKGF